MDQSNPRLNMKHGFIHHIRRNQMKRDEYDKEVKAKADKKKTAPKSDTPKYPDQEVYRPKANGKYPGSGSPREGSPLNREPGQAKLLYCMEYHDNNGFVHKLFVHKNDDPKVLAKRLVAAANIPKQLLETLEWKLEQEIVKRDTAVS